jgi:hypothetical protein
MDRSVRSNRALGSNAPPLNHGSEQLADAGSQTHGEGSPEGDPQDRTTYWRPAGLGAQSAQQEENQNGFNRQCSK